MSCERCQAEQQRADRIAVDLQSAEQELRAKRREIGRLKAELKGPAERDPSSQIVTELLDYWRKATGHTKAKIPLDGVRAKNCRDRLKDHTPHELKQALEGYARFPYVRDAKRVATGDPLIERHDDAELIFRNEKTVANGIKLLARARAEEQKVVPVAGTTMVELPPELAADVKWLLETCDCSHRRMAHSRSDSDGRQGCLHHGCDCLDFDDLMTRAEGWKAERLSGRAA